MSKSLEQRVKRLENGRRRSPVNVRIRPELRDFLEREAAETGRTLSAEIETRLEASMAAQDQRAMMREVVAEALAERDAAEIAEGNRVLNDPMLEALWARHNA